MAGKLETAVQEDCRTPYDGKGRGWLYAWATALLCPCHMPVWGVILGGSAADTFFQQNFWPIAIGLGLMTFLSLYKAVRILL